MTNSHKSDIASAARRLRALGYCRVSTGRQAAHEISLEEQDRKIRACAELKDADLVEMYVEGASGRTDKRATFQQMVTFALNRNNCIDYIVVYNFSRYFRNVLQYLEYRKKLKDASVRLISATQDIPEGATGDLFETILAAFDGHASEVNADTVHDMMVANAEAGYWNGAPQPFGYRTQTVAVLRKKEKKRLVIVEEEAVIVRFIYKLCLEGDASTGPLGIKAISTLLNDRGITKRGKAFRTSAVEAVLKSETYAGTAFFNRTDSRTRRPRPESEWVKIAVPAIVSRETHVAVQRHLESRRPNRTPPRYVNGPSLLPPLAKCDCCTTSDGQRAGMMMSTGKSGQYYYLGCANRATKSVRSCDAPLIRMDRIDELVISEVEAKVLSSHRVKLLLRAMIDRQSGARAETEAELRRQKAALSKAESGIRSLYAALADAPELVKLDDPIYREQLALLNRQRAELNASISALENRLRSGPIELSDERIELFSRTVKQRLRSADPTFRRQWLRLFVDEVLIGRTEIAISGRTEALLNGVQGRPDFFCPTVPSLDREWRARENETDNMYVIEIAM